MTLPVDRFSEETATFTVQGKDVPDLDRGVAAIRNVLATLPLRPGVYRMTDAGGDVLYIGKARSLKNRVGNYVQVNRLSRRLQRMVSQTRDMTIVTTNSEAEALLLEAQLIKRYRPPYNVLLRDDKSFPFIVLREDHGFPRIGKHRGARIGKTSYYGPFASAGAVNLGAAEDAGVSGPLGSSGSIVFSGGTLQNSATNTHDYSGRFSAAANQIYRADTNSQNVTWAADLTSSGGTLAKLGAGSLPLSGNNTFTGNVTISTGELKITNASALGSGTKTINAQNPGYLSLDGSSGNIALTSNLSITTAGLSILNLVGDNVINGTIRTIAGNGTSTITSDGGTLNLAGNIDSGATGNRILELSGTSTGANTVNGTISNGTATLAVTKSGAGTWTLTSDNNYTGATNVTNGKLVVNGSISTSSLTTIASGATLAGSGTVGKTIVNGTLAVGNSPGQMDFTDTLSLAGTTLMEIDGTDGAGITNGHDFVNLTGLGAAGVLTYGGAMTLDIGVIFGAGTYSWNLFDMASETGTFATISLGDQYFGSLLDADLNGIWDLTSGDNTWQFTESTGVLDLAVIPEPSAAALLGGMGILALLRRRRSNQSQLPQETRERLKCR